jgi:putative DNA primase/helicase
MSDNDNNNDDVHSIVARFRVGTDASVDAEAHGNLVRLLSFNTDDIKPGPTDNSVVEQTEIKSKAPAPTPTADEALPIPLMEIIGKASSKEIADALDRAGTASDDDEDDGDEIGDVELVEWSPKQMPAPVRRTASRPGAEAKPSAEKWADPDRRGMVIKDANSLQNVRRMIALLGIDCRYDLFHNKWMIAGDLSTRGGAVFEDMNYKALMVKNLITKRWSHLEVSKSLIIEALEAKCLDRAFNPVVDYLDGLHWDRRPRVDRWLIDYCGAEDTPYVRAVGRKVLVAAVRRARQPGCKFDYMMVMEGPQGAGKSTALQILAGGQENFSDARIFGARTGGEKEHQEQIGGVWVYEIAELSGRYIDVEQVKHFLSKTHDSARGAYAHNRSDQPRQCVFIATTNNDHYLKDATRNRRFWPVKVTSIDLSALSADRNQLWAEAAEAEAAGEGLVIPSSLWSVAAAITNSRMEVDPWADILSAKLDRLAEALSAGLLISTKLFAKADEISGQHWRVASEYLLGEAVLDVNPSVWNAKRLADVMRSIGWHSAPNPLRFGSAGQKRGFTKPIDDQA